MKKIKSISEVKISSNSYYLLIDYCNEKKEEYIVLVGTILDCETRPKEPVYIMSNANPVSTTGGQLIFFKYDKVIGNGNNIHTFYSDEPFWVYIDNYISLYSIDRKTESQIKKALILEFLT